LYKQFYLSNSIIAVLSTDAGGSNPCSNLATSQFFEEEGQQNFPISVFAKCICILLSVVVKINQNTVIYSNFY
jgi:hypothetical protein